MKLRIITVSMLFLISILCSCSKMPLDKVIAEDLLILKEGEQRIFKLDPGTYKLELTSSGDGASIEWVGASCQNTLETSSLTTVCRFTQIGQVIIGNPTSLGLGESISVTLKLTKLARDI